MSDIEIRRTKLRYFFIMGAVLIVGAVVVQIIPTMFLASINGKIDLLELRGSLTEAQRQTLTDLRWNKSWWETVQASVFNPISTILLAIGIILIVYGLIVRFV